jgi:hypothetical protein
MSVRPARIRTLNCADSSAPNREARTVAATVVPRDWWSGTQEQCKARWFSGGSPHPVRFARAHRRSDSAPLVLARWEPQEHGSHIPLGHQDRPVQEKWSLRRHRPLSSGTHSIRLSVVGMTFTLTHILLEPQRQEHPTDERRPHHACRAHLYGPGHVRRTAISLEVDGAADTGVEAPEAAQTTSTTITETLSLAPPSVARRTS